LEISFKPLILLHETKNQTRMKAVSHNGFGLAEGLDFEKRQPIKALKIN